MKLKTLIAVAIAGAFALPFAAQASADGDRMILAQAGGPAGSSSVGTGPTGGTPSPQTAGEPKAATGARGDATVGASGTDRCVGLTGMERDNCMRDARVSGSASGSTTGSADTATGGATTAPASGVVSPSGSGTTGATGGSGTSTNQTAPSSATSTSPSTSGQGNAK